MVNRTMAEAIQLQMEYNPAPPFNSGSPDTAPAEVMALLGARGAQNQARRLEAVKRAADLGVYLLSGEDESSSTGQPSD